MADILGPAQILVFPRGGGSLPQSARVTTNIVAARDPMVWVKSGRSSTGTAGQATRLLGAIIIGLGILRSMGDSPCVDRHLLFGYSSFPGVPRDTHEIEPGITSKAASTDP